MPVAVCEAGIALAGPSNQSPVAKEPTVDSDRSAAADSSYFFAMHLFPVGMHKPILLCGGFADERACPQFAPIVGPCAHFD